MRSRIQYGGFGTGFASGLTSGMTIAKQYQEMQQAKAKQQFWKDMAADMNAKKAPPVAANSDARYGDNAPSSVLPGVADGATVNPDYGTANAGGTFGGSKGAGAIPGTPSHTFGSRVALGDSGAHAAEPDAPAPAPTQASNSPSLMDVGGAGLNYLEG